MKNFTLKILFEPRDLWIGIFWDADWMWDHYSEERPKKLYMTQFRLFITIIPMFPLRLVVHVQPFLAWWSRLLTPRAVDPPSACEGCGVVPGQGEHDRNCPVVSAGN